MNCRDLERWIIPYASGAEVPQDVSAHIDGCEQCRRLAGALRAAQAPPSPSAEELKRIAAGAVPDVKPVKPLVSEGVLFLALMLAVAIVAAIGAALLGTAGFRALSPVQKIPVFAWLTGGAGLLGFSLGRLIVPGSRLLLRPGGLVAALLGVLIVMFALLFHPRAEATFVATGLVCLRIGLECAISAALLFWFLLRRGAILRPVVAGATLGALAGLSGLVVLEIFCPNLNAYHILAWHLGAVLASTLGGLAAGRMVE